MHQAATTNPVNHRVQVQYVQMKFTTDLPPVVELDEEINATETEVDVAVNIAGLRGRKWFPRVQ